MWGREERIAFYHFNGIQSDQSLAIFLRIEERQKKAVAERAICRKEKKSDTGA